MCFSTEITQAVMLADVHNFKLVLIVPLKTMKARFSLNRMAVLPTRISNHTFVQFEIEKD
jgi:hypothetical protein